MTASSVIIGEDFPELSNSVSVMDWPAFVANERCVMPSNVGEDFSGPGCTGNLVELTPRPDIHCEMPATVGESFAGEVRTGDPLRIAPSDAAENNAGKHQHKTGAPNELAANEVMIQLDMKLTRTDSGRSAIAGK